VEISERRFIQGLSANEERQTISAFLAETLQKHPLLNQEKKPRVFFYFLNN
jgi:hypothetical protein